MTKRRYRLALVVEDDDQRQVRLPARLAWALEQLIDAGPRGCTPIDRPAPRWSAYVHRLRHEFGLAVETVTERHGGAFPGSHARYRLRSDVAVLPASEGAGEGS